MDGNESFFETVFDDQMETFNVIVSRIKKKYPKMTDSIISGIISGLLFNGAQLENLPNMKDISFRVKIDETQIKELIDSILSIKGSKVILEKMSINLNEEHGHLPRDGSMVLEIPYMSGGHMKRGHFLFQFEKNYKNDYYLTLNGPRAARQFIIETLIPKYINISMNKPMIFVTQTYKRKDVFKIVIETIGLDKVVSTNDKYGHAYNLKPSDITGETSYLSEGQIIARLEYTSDVGDDIEGDFEIAVEDQYDKQELKFVGPSDSKNFLQSLLNEINEKTKSQIKIRCNTHIKFDLNDLKNRLEGYDIKFSAKETEIIGILEKDKIILQEGQVKISGKNKKDILINIEDSYSEDGAKIEVMGDQDMIKEMQQILAKISTPPRDKVSTFSNEPIKISGYSKNDIAGMDKAFEELSDVMLYLANPEAFSSLGLTQEKGVLLTGPPGTGKTLFAKVLASITDSNFLYIRASDLTSYWYGEEQKNIHRMFDMARSKVPCLVFIDEIDGLTPKRDKNNEYANRSINQFLMELDGLEELKGVVLICATNRMEAVEPALLRGGRISRQIEIPLPDEATRARIFEIHSKDMNMAKKISWKQIIQMTEGLSGADIKVICNMAGIEALKEYLVKGSKKITDLDKKDYKNLQINSSHLIKAVGHFKSQKEKKKEENQQQYA